MLNQPPQLVDGKLPVFVFPTSLVFFSDDQASHKQVLTLYNPYDFPLRFKVLPPRKYTVVESEGTIRPRCCVDIVVRHLDICVNNEGVKDKFRIQVTEHGYRKVLGEKDVTGLLLPRKEQSIQSDDNFQSLPSVPQGSGAPSDVPLSIPTGHQGNSRSSTSGSPSLIIVALAVCCILALMLPLQGETTSSFPESLHLSVHQKLIAAYILGLVTMVILQL
ncbi:hypothetical protein ScPMuIL_018655 [Solemya velum]